MAHARLVETLSFIEPVMYAVTLLVIAGRRQVRAYVFVSAFLLVRFLSTAILVELAYGAIHLTPKILYPIYFYTYWGSYLIETLLGFGIILSIYRLAMAPLKGLQKLGMLMFRWAGGIALLVAVTIAIGPKVTGTAFAQRAIIQLQQTQSILTLCMLLFVCLAIRPMGLSHRSKIFGICLGLGVLATLDLVNAAWFSQVKGSMVSLVSLIECVGSLVFVSTWMVYFVVPEPKRRMIVLPTTSPFLRWNQISLALGDEPGFVAVGDVSPDMFAPAEVEVMRRASLKMRRLAN